MDIQQAARVLGGDVHGSQILAPGPNHSHRDRSMSIKFSHGAAVTEYLFQFLTNSNNFD